MQYADLAFNIEPVLHPDGFPWRWLWLDAGCIALMGGILAKVILRNLRRHPPLPVKDPRLSEALGLYEIPAPGAMHGPGSAGSLPGPPLDCREGLGE